MNADRFIVTIEMGSYGPHSAEQIAELVRRTIETHPTMSFRVDVVKAVRARETQEITSGDVGKLSDVLGEGGQPAKLPDHECG